MNESVNQSFNQPINLVFYPEGTRFYLIPSGFGFFVVSRMLHRHVSQDHFLPELRHWLKFRTVFGTQALFLNV